MWRKLQKLLLHRTLMSNEKGCASDSPPQNAPFIIPVCSVSFSSMKAPDTLGPLGSALSVSHHSYSSWFQGCVPVRAGVPLPAVTATSDGVRLPEGAQRLKYHRKQTHASSQSSLTLAPCCFCKHKGLVLCSCRSVSAWWWSVCSVSSTLTRTETGLRVTPDPAWRSRRHQCFITVDLLFMFEALGKYFWFEKYINIYSQTIQYKQLWQRCALEVWFFHPILQFFPSPELFIYSCIHLFISLAHLKQLMLAKTIYIVKQINSIYKPDKLTVKVTLVIINLQWQILLKHLS